ncbi:hypothetical protein Dred_0978 [Desulforamulus reducens MI-1]|uniref:Uncharacterized protein n=1 Tax=Desulforamulus reducens (strain ATCC BAA-1160 / DSM 100696 / MI-1) TaxID=349161 RepID=A4J360_DESRM|nr:hypothetical protein [Desulforamulus reducens]ABO49513.1 hypothetical protein Dred_0978 [Desulforamulus reducens MI-1]
MGVPNIEISGKIVKDSAFAIGRSMVVSKRQVSSEINLYPSGMDLEILKMLSINEALMLNSLVRLFDSYRTKIDKLLIKLSNRGLVKNVSVATEHTMFKLWLPMDTKVPRNAQEACRLAMLGTFFSLAFKEIPNLQWRLIRNNKAPVLAEMTFIGKNGEEKWIIDVPRRGEKPQEKATLYIFPTIEEAVSLTPKGRRFTSDLFLLKNAGTPLNKRLLEHSN